MHRSGRLRQPEISRELPRGSEGCIWQPNVGWICLYEARGGAKARAVFATEEEARQFAERHAQVTATRMPLKWDDTNDPTMLTTPMGNYWIAQTVED
jgi:hypothetical protein